MSETMKITLSNGVRWTLLLQLVAIIWAAATLTSKVNANTTTINAVEVTTNSHTVDLARIGVQLENIEEKLDR